MKVCNHSPLPYRAASNMDGRHQAIPIMCEAPEFKTDDWPYHPRLGSITHGKGHADMKTAQATANFIALACNSHYELLRLVKQFRERTARRREENYKAGWSSVYLDELIHEIDEVLSVVETITPPITPKPTKG